MALLFRCRRQMLLPPFMLFHYAMLRHADARSASAIAELAMSLRRRHDAVAPLFAY